MKKSIITFVIYMFMMITVQQVFAQDWIHYVTEQTKGKEDNFLAIQKAFNDYWNGKPPAKGLGYKQFRRWEWFWEQRINVDGSFPENDVVVKEWKKYINENGDNPRAPGTTGNWTALGPNSSLGGYAGLGRINCIAFHPTDFNTFWVGTPSGGLWKTTNFGGTWETVTDNMPVLGVSDIAVNPTNPSIVYIATGDGDLGTLSSCTGSPKGDTKSIGILKSTDGGNTWNATGMNWSVTDAKLIRRLIINPNDPNILYAAASDGIWKTTNGGTTWSNVNSNYYFIDAEFKPNNPNTIYASTYDPSNLDAEILVSYDGGNSWYITDLNEIQRINVAVTAAQPDKVLAVCTNSQGGYAGYVSSTSSLSTYSFYASNADCSNNFLNTYYPFQGCNGQGWYDLAFVINPTNANEIYLGGVNTWKSTDGFSTLTLNNYWTTNSYNKPIVHADKHFIAYHPLNPSYIFECNDGGLYWTNNGGTSWNDISNGLQISQIYRIGDAANLAQDIICGLQDNGSKELYNGTWDDVTGGDGMECAIDPTNANIEYASYANGVIYRTLDWWTTQVTISENLPGGQQTGAWVTPYVLDPANPQTIYAGYTDIYKTTNRGNSWTQISSGMTQGATLRSIAVSAGNSQVIYAAKFSAIYKTTNGGSTWADITNGLPPYPARISYIAISPTDANTLYVTISGYVSGNKVYKSTNGGASWNNISGSLPNLPVNCLVYQTGSNEGLYIGTDVGVFYKNASMSDWIYYSTGLPNVVITELEIHYSSGKICAATYGRGLWESDTYVVTNYQINTVSNPSYGGTTSGGGSYAQGSTATVTATTNSNWDFLNWTENGNIVSTSLSYSFQVLGDRTLTANFTQQPTYTITTTSNPLAGGTTTGSGTYIEGQQCTLTAYLNSGYDFLNWTENGNVVSTNTSYTFTVVADRNLVANFSLQQYTVSTSSNPSGGGTTSGGGTYSYGTSVTVIATANNDWAFINWTENGNVVSTDSEYNFIITQNRNLTANFEQDIIQYMITTTSSPTYAGYTSGGGVYNSGAQATVQAYSNPGWSFFNWTEFGSQVSLEPIYSFTVNSDRDLTANFLQQFTITATASPIGAGYTIGGGIYTSGQTANLQAIHNEGYVFYHWTENGTVVSTSSNYSFVVTGNRDLVAAFLSNVGFDEQVITEIEIYPIPASDLLMIENFAGFNNAIEKIDIINSTGQIKSKLNPNASSNRITIDVSIYSPGLYFLKIQLQDGSQKTFKIIIEHL